jgi:hypothetical protein
MKTSLVKYAVALFITGLIFGACKKGNQPQTFQGKGVINLDVLFTCAGCQGATYGIRFAADTTNLYYIGNNIAQFGITPSSKFPLNVSVNWKPETMGASNFVIITALKVDN